MSIMRGFLAPDLAYMRGVPVMLLYLVKKLLKAPHLNQGTGTTEPKQYMVPLKPSSMMETEASTLSKLDSHLVRPNHRSSRQKTWATREQSRWARARGSWSSSRRSEYLNQTMPALPQSPQSPSAVALSSVLILPPRRYVDYLRTCCQTRCGSVSIGAAASTLGLCVGDLCVDFCVCVLRFRPASCVLASSRGG